MEHMVGQVQDFRHLKDMGEDDGVQLPLQIENLPRQRVQLGGRCRGADREAVHAGGLNSSDIKHTQKLPARPWSVNLRGTATRSVQTVPVDNERPGAME